MARSGEALKLAGSLILVGLGGCAPGSPGDSGTSGIGPNLVDCAYTQTTSEVPFEDVQDHEALLAYLAQARPTPASWWDGAATEFLAVLDTEAVPSMAEETAYAFDAALSSENATQESCGTFHYRSFTLPVLEAGTTDGHLTAGAAEAELVCTDNPANLEPPEAGLPEGLCSVRVAYNLLVEVDPTRLPSGVVGPFVAEITVDSQRDGDLVAHVWGADATDPEDSSGATATTGAPGSAILGTTSGG